YADDTELADFGLYSRCPEASNIYLTQGVIEAGHYKLFVLSLHEASPQKARMSAWEIQSVHVLGGVSQRCYVLLGYYFSNLSTFSEAPGQAFPSRESGETDIRSVRRHNPLALPGDTDGEPNWRNLVADLAALLEHFRPEVLVTPHP